ncbi:MAG: TetR/AcrR family transcriptional regulator [Actinomycetota bacterium]|nr:TetR/AcrR family transcriptional regulator [Actinomycetota bacterium]
MGDLGRAAASGLTRTLPSAVATPQRVIDAALRAFGTAGYDATSLDALATELGITKQTILYHFPSKDALLEAVIDDAGAELGAVVEAGLVTAGPGWGRIEAVVRSVFRLAGRRPELLGLLREASRLGPPPATRLRQQLDPFITRATAFLEDEMAAGQVRRTDARLLLLSAYSTVIGVATEVEVLRALGVEPTGRSLVRRRAELLGFLRSALVAERT